MTDPQSSSTPEIIKETTCSLAQRSERQQIPLHRQSNQNSQHTQHLPCIGNHSLRRYHPLHMMAPRIRCHGSVGSSNSSEGSHIPMTTKSVCSFSCYRCSASLVHLSNEGHTSLIGSTSPAASTTTSDHQTTTTNSSWCPWDKPAVSTTTPTACSRICYTTGHSISGNRPTSTSTASRSPSDHRWSNTSHRT